MSITLIGALFSTCLTLFVVPVIYSLLESAGEGNPAQVGESVNVDK